MKDGVSLMQGGDAFSSSSCLCASLSLCRICMCCFLKSLTRPCNTALTGGGGFGSSRGSRASHHHGGRWYHEPAYSEPEDDDEDEDAYYDHADIFAQFRRAREEASRAQGAAR